MARNKTAIVTGAQQGIGAGLVDGSLKSGYRVPATSLRADESLLTPDLVVIRGDARDYETATEGVGAALTRFGSGDVLTLESTSPSHSQTFQRTTSTGVCSAHLKSQAKSFTWTGRSYWALVA